MTVKTAAAVAVVAALLVALPATAATLITSRQIKNNTIKSADIRNGTLRLADFARSTRSRLRGPRGPQGPQGPQGLVGPTGPQGLTDVFYVDGPVVSVAAGSAGTSTATCPAGSSATGGGIGFGTDIEMMPVEFHTVGILGFTVVASNPDTVPHNLRATVACARR